MIRRALPFLSLVLLLLGLAAAPAQAQHATPTPTPTPAGVARPDACEPNATAAGACALPLDSVSGPFTFSPAGDQDWYTVDLGQPDGLATRIAVRADDGLDLLVSLRRPDSSVLASFATPAISTTLDPAIGGSILIRVENRAPHSPLDSAYTIELRKTLPAAPANGAEAAPDALENNWDAAHASPIAIETIYDLTLVCPERRPDACPGGDHDVLRFPVKAGTTYLIATFDLGPGVDTILELFLDDVQGAPLLANDDARPGGGLLSVIRWTAPRNTTAFLRVGPRTGGITPRLGEQTAGAGSYRLAVALARSTLAAQIEGRIAEQTNAPTSRAGSPGGPSGPAPAATATTAEAGGPGGPIVQGDSVKGQAVTLATTTVRLRPDPSGETIQVLAPDTVVTLLGKHSNLWVRVQTDQAVLAGWVLATDLRRVDPAAAAAAPTSLPAAPAAAAPDTGNPSQSPTPLPQAATGGRTWQVTALPPLTIVEPTAMPRTTQTITVSVRMRRGPLPAKTPAPSLRATPLPSTPVAGLRIQLVDAFGDLLAEAISPADGIVTLTREVAPGTALFVRLPALGIQAPVDSPSMSITIPEAP